MVSRIICVLNIDYCKCWVDSEPTDVLLVTKKRSHLLGEEKVWLGKMGSRFLLLLNLENYAFDGVG